jgi:hypothetical protein
VRLACYFHCPVRDSQYSLWRFGCIADKHSACPSGHAVVLDMENELWLPEQCGRVEAIRPSREHDSLIRNAIALGYRVRPRHTSFGEALEQPDTRVGAFTIRPESMLAQRPEDPFHAFAKRYDLYEGDDGELYVYDRGPWFHYMDEKLLR